MVTGYLGPRGSYSMLAAQKLMPSAVLKDFQSFPAVMRSLVEGITDCIVLPIENTLNGGVLQNMDLLQYSDGVYADREEVIKIDHRLITQKGADKRGITKIYSHPQALEQCARYLVENFPEAKLITVSSTAAGLEMLKSGTEACIVGAHNADKKFEVSADNIADERNNFTHFLLVKRGRIPEDKNSQKIYFSASCPNRSGSLIKLLQRIAAHGLNMTKIESRPVKDVPEEYRFFIETEGDYSKSAVKAALEDIKRNSTGFKLLGCY